MVKIYNILVSPTGKEVTITNVHVANEGALLLNTYENIKSYVEDQALLAVKEYMKSIAHDDEVVFGKDYSSHALTQDTILFRFGILNSEYFVLSLFVKG